MLKIIFLSLLLQATTVFAVEKHDFTEARFNQLKEQGAVVLVDIYANWCPTCAEQQVILEQWKADNPDAALHILQVNYSTQRDAVIALRATRQSTLMLYHGHERIWYSVA